MITARSTLALVLVLGLGSGCKKAETPAPATPSGAPTAPATASAAPAATPTPSAQPGAAAGAPSQDPLAGLKLPPKIGISHILFSYKGAKRAAPNVTRDREAARKAAAEALAKIRGGAKFDEVARADNDDRVAKSRGGFMGVLPRFFLRRMPPEFARVAATLAEGTVSDVVETPFGFHIIRREKVEEIRASHVLYMYKGSMRAPASVTRTKDEARKAAESALARLKRGTKIQEIAAKESDCPSRAKGGDLGSFARGQMHPNFEKAAFALEVGGISDVVETPFGFHVIQRTN